MIIPCYNVGSYVDKAVRSVMQQTHTDLDVYAVDDGSSDGTNGKLAGLEREFPGRFRWESTSNGGACRARNRGLAKTNGDYVQFLDADDVLEPDKIAGQLALLGTGDDPALIVGGYRNMTEDGVGEDVVPDNGGAWMALIRTRLGTTTSDLWERKAVLEVGGWDEGLGSSQDYDLAFRVMRAGGGVTFDPRITATILKRSQGSIGRVDEVGNWKRYIALRVAIRDHLRALDPVVYEAEIAEVDQYIFRAVRVLARSDRHVAEQLRAKHLSPGFLPLPGEALSTSYVLVYRSLGFQTAEFAASVLDNLRGITGRR